MKVAVVGFVTSMQPAGTQTTRCLLLGEDGL